MGVRFIEVGDAVVLRPEVVTASRQAGVVVDYWPGHEYELNIEFPDGRVLAYREREIELVR